MIKNYLTVAIRNLARHRIYSAINIIGIAIGLAFCILTYLFVHNEWTYDTFHENADRIYRVYIKQYFGQFFLKVTKNHRQKSAVHADWMSKISKSTTIQTSETAQWNWQKRYSIG